MIISKNLPPARDPRIYMAVERTYLEYLRFGLSTVTFGFFFYKVGDIVFSGRRLLGSPVYFSITLAAALAGLGMIVFSIFSFIFDMKYISKGIEVDKKETTDPRIYMAAERTFLAWVRTSISLIIFGFVVENFEMLLKQIGQASRMEVFHSTSLVEVGLFIILMGVGTVLIGIMNFRSALRQIDVGFYRTNERMYKIFGALIFITSLVIIGFMLRLVE
ncbi:MAG: DUF202 domain-containing protein [Nitrospinae bacterium]|nr:DUF202 domain-containing protein [Nitrospinota bacterium]